MYMFVYINEIYRHVVEGIAIHVGTSITFLVYGQH